MRVGRRAGVGGKLGGWADRLGKTGRQAAGWVGGQAGADRQEAGWAAGWVGGGRNSYISPHVYGVSTDLVLYRSLQDLQKQKHQTMD